MLNSADTDFCRSRKHHRDEEAAGAERGEVRAVQQLEQITAGNTSVLIPESDEDVCIVNLLKVNKTMHQQCGK